MGYHKTKIVKGELGLISKVQEEIDEYKDAIEQDNKIMAMLELSDIYGALEEVATKNNLSMSDLKTMSDATKSAFKDGSRKQTDKILKEHSNDDVFNIIGKYTIELVGDNFFNINKILKDDDYDVVANAVGFEEAKQKILKIINKSNNSDDLLQYTLIDGVSYYYSVQKPPHIINKPNL